MGGWVGNGPVWVLGKRAEFAAAVGKRVVDLKLSYGIRRNVEF